jgi:hypothetical protein
MFEHFPAMFEAGRGTTKATIIITDNGHKKTFQISGQMNNRMIALCREQMDALEERVHKKETAK